MDSDRFDPSARLHEFQQRLIGLLRSSPAAELEQHVRALMTQTFERMELVTRDDFEVQVELLAALRERVAVLERRLDAPPHAGPVPAGTPAPDAGTPAPGHGDGTGPSRS